MEKRQHGGLKKKSEIAGNPESVNGGEQRCA